MRGLQLLPSSRLAAAAVPPCDGPQETTRPRLVVRGAEASSHTHSSQANPVVLAVQGGMTLDGLTAIESQLLL